MSDAPGQLDVRWRAAGVEIATHPLRTHPKERDEFWPAALGNAGLLSFVATPPLLLLSTLDLIGETVPPAVLTVVAGLGLLSEILLRWRRENAQLTLKIDPSEVSLIHRMGPLPVVTETVELERIQRVEVDPRGTLRLVLTDGRSIVEPLPALTAEARNWIVNTLQEARRSNAEFWRGQVASAASQEAMRRLADRVRSET